MAPGDPYDIAALRQEYAAAGLDEAEANPDPIAQFRLWLDAALEAGIPEPNAMVLSTATPDGVPSSRTVLLKGLDTDGFSFFTNLSSRKGRELAANLHAALVFPWIALRRQVCIRGTVAAIPDDAADAYFASRPRGSQLAAWASDQSSDLADRATLEDRMAQARQRFGDRPVPRPPHWGGYRLAPEEIEFWQGRADRLHDRLLYTAGPNGWNRRRLFP